MAFSPELTIMAGRMITSRNHPLTRTWRSWKFAVRRKINPPTNRDHARSKKWFQILTQENIYGFREVEEE